MGAIESRVLPEPNFMVERIASGNVQAHYCLARPVHRGPEARERPLQTLARVAEYLTEAAHADPGYTGVLARNPIETAHHDPRAGDGPVRTIWRRRRPYTLSELTNCIPLGWRRPSVALSPIGRNVTVFRALMRESGKPRNWGRPVAPLAAAVNDAIGRLFPPAPSTPASSPASCAASSASRTATSLPAAPKPDSRASRPSAGGAAAGSPGRCGARAASRRPRRGRPRVSRGGRGIGDGRKRHSVPVSRPPRARGTLPDRGDYPRPVTLEPKQVRRGPT